MSMVGCDECESPATAVLNPKNSGISIVPKNAIRFNSETSSARLVIKNNTDKSIMYKVETTAPEFFSISPRFGLLEPTHYAKVKVKIRKEASGEDFNSDSDKFTVRYLHPDEHELDITCQTDRIRNIFDLSETEVIKALCIDHDEDALSRKVYTMMAVFLAPLIGFGLYVLANY